ncbi:alpha/beta hydrolase family protein [Azospirillum humicireducens]|uniref:alpha/beta hydrolase family protein n=1 Tax=Azospirillum humicireducens TaxID=1226968 RepID=UPI0011B23E09|nr:hypothetical protein [Azospirillum humicireducens]
MIALLKVALVTLLLPAATGSALSGLPETTVAVGYRSMTIASPARGGEVTVGIWYPAASDGDGGAGTLVGGSRVFEPTPARTGALPQGRHPLLVMAHGGLRAGGHIGDWLAAGMARAGYVVALVEPVGFQPDGAGVLKELTARPADMSAAISALLGNAELSSTIEPGRIGTVGLLRGGTSAMALLGVRISGERYRSLCERSPEDRDCRWFAKAGISFSGLDLGPVGADHRDARVVAGVAVAPELTSIMTSEGLTAASRSMSVLLLDDAAIPGAKVDDLAGFLPPDRLRSVAGATPFSLFPICATQAAALLRENGEDASLCRDDAGPNRMAIHRELRDMIIRALSELGLPPRQADLR